MKPYRWVRPALFRMPPETAHGVTLRALRVASRVTPGVRAARRLTAPNDARQRVDAFGVTFDGPLGLAAGMDKDADALPAWAAMGLGHVELGTVTPEPQPGNPKPRATRLPDDAATVNAMGFPSLGADAVARRLEALHAAGRWPDARVGVNLGKNRATPLEDAADDYRRVAKTMRAYADFLVVNVSSPNTPGLRDLQEADALERILDATTAAAEPRPVLVKLAPDLPDAALADLATRLEARGVAGLVAVNTTIARSGLRRDPGVAGGLSGRPLAPRAREVLAVLRAATDLPIVSVGGIDGPEEALARLEAGADLLQLYTGLIYEGPGLPRAIHAALKARLDATGAPSLRALRTARPEA
ncbi:MAG: quinone-dependent dihydroorotate dehydrogenase [Trueperaceae bacterium]|nr:quinone-dependent dihydroorotate dehydrogenase [Trueperaceae bacterium]